MHKARGSARGPTNFIIRLLLSCPPSTLSTGQWVNRSKQGASREEEWCTSCHACTFCAPSCATALLHNPNRIGSTRSSRSEEGWGLIPTASPHSAPDSSVIWVPRHSVSIKGEDLCTPSRGSRAEAAEGVLRRESAAHPPCGCSVGGQSAQYAVLRPPKPTRTQNRPETRTTEGVDQLRMSVSHAVCLEW